MLKRRFRINKKKILKLEFKMVQNSAIKDIFENGEGIILYYLMILNQKELSTIQNLFMN